MFEKIVYISDHGAHVKVNDVRVNMINQHLIFTDGLRQIVAEVEYVHDDIIETRFIGEIVNGKFQGGIIAKPSLTSSIRLMEESEMVMITGTNEFGNMTIGVSPFYDNKPVYMSINSIFSNHLTILGNSGSGKSYGTTRLLQSVYQTPQFYPYKASMIIFDNNGEYIKAFSNLNQINPNYNFKVITTSNYNNFEKLRIPVWLLTIDDLALLLKLEKVSQLTLLERMIKLAKIFSLTDDISYRYKNHIIAKAMLSIFYSNRQSSTKRNDIFGIFNTCTTNEFNMEAVVQGAGYTRKFRECFNVDRDGNFTESILVSKYIASFVDPELDNYEPETFNKYTLEDLEKALEFTLISENWLNNDKTYGDSIAVKVKLHSLIISENKKFFEYDNFIGVEEYLSSLVIENGKKYQLVNINLEDIDDSIAKVIVKIFSRIIFEYTKGLQNRATIPFNLIVEEAHRYIKSGEDIDLIGYNIFDRIAKEGRKYGVLLTLISQRPVELSETVMSQCANFLIFKTTHPRDIEYISKMVPNITEEIVEKQKALQPGYCLCFGAAFKVPLILKVDMPNPVPESSNCNVIETWTIRK
ncbi:MAG: DUF87 domain-containing protein [Bacilli bacterium]|nr:DUF87 domain-containing protein [Bacilli bacterium]